MSIREQDIEITLDAMREFHPEAYTVFLKGMKFAMDHPLTCEAMKDSIFKRLEIAGEYER